MLDYHVFVKRTNLRTTKNYQRLINKGDFAVSVATTREDVVRELNTQALHTLDALKDAGFEDVQIKSITPILGVGIQDINTNEELEKEGKIDRKELEFRCRWIASQMEEVINHRATLDVIAIMNANEDQLKQGIEYYESKGREHFEKMIAIEATEPRTFENQEWNTEKGSFEYYSWLYWQCARRLGLT